MTVIDILLRLKNEFDINSAHVKNIVELIDDGNTIPFIARYRKEATGEVDDQVLREFADRLKYLRALEQRKTDVCRLIEEQGKLTDSVRDSILACEILQEVEDIYLPFKPKRRTRAMIAREKGLQPLADAIFAQNIFKGTIDDIAAAYINESLGVQSCSDAIKGAMDIIAEQVSENALYRKIVRELTLNHGTFAAKSIKEGDSVYRLYYDFREAMLLVPSHRVLAVDRGENEGWIKASVEVDENFTLNYLINQTVEPAKCVTTNCVIDAVIDAYDRLIAPSIERELRAFLTERAQEQAIRLFCENLKNLLLQPPTKDKCVLGFDPAYRTGCKIAVVDGIGKVLHTAVVYPTPPHSKIDESKAVLKKFIEKYQVDIVSIGNGTASKESEIFVAQLIKEVDRKVQYIVVSEAGASVYSASQLAAQEFPELDVSLRSAISIARRLQDPLAELVKIDPKAIGVGQYQHDMNQKRLGESLGGVVEQCVNNVGVDLNTASAELLEHVSGINSGIAKNIVQFREQNGKFSTRAQLKKIGKLGAKAFIQCAGFLRISDGKNILDNTSVHPESYETAERLLEIAGYTLKDVVKKKHTKLKEKIESEGIDAVAKRLEVGSPTLRDIIEELQKPGRDPRASLPKPDLRSDVFDMADLKPGMVMTGTVRNVIDFGAFVDIGVHQDGLVHISQLSEKYVAHPTSVVSVGDIVKVRVLNVEKNTNKIALSMIDLKQMPKAAKR